MEREREVRVVNHGIYLEEFVKSREILQWEEKQASKVAIHSGYPELRHITRGARVASPVKFASAKNRRLFFTQAKTQVRTNPTAPG